MHQDPAPDFPPDDDASVVLRLPREQAELVRQIMTYIAAGRRLGLLAFWIVAACTAVAMCFYYVLGAMNNFHGYHNLK